MMNYSSYIVRSAARCGLAVTLFLTAYAATLAQNCPENTPASIGSNPNTYYPAIDNALDAGSTTVALGASSAGSTPIGTGDLLLIIQMQGAQINSSNTNSYGDGTSGGFAHGYLSNSDMIAGNMEYIIAGNSVPLEGGTLNLTHPTTYSYRNAPFGANGQYRYQVIRVGLYHSLTLTGTITAPQWNGTTGGVVVINVTHDLNLNGQTISAAGAGFRGGGGRQLGGASGGLNTDVVSMSTSNFNGSKGEGIAGTPRFVNNHGTLLDHGVSSEGYPGGSYSAGGPGNAGGGGTDGRPSANDQNAGGGGGSNGGEGGKGGNSWSSNLPTGGDPGALFAQRSPSRMVMGGGGGAGTTNNGTGTPGAGFASSGAAGGGIVLLTSGTISGSGTINVNGANSYTTVANDANGGGGAGGSVLIYSGSGLSNVTVTANGGTGGTNSGGGSPPPHGPGGGGGGGVIYSNAPLSPASSVSGGAAGRTSSSDIYGAGAGSNGSLTQNISRTDLPPMYLVCSVLPSRFKAINATIDLKSIIISWQVLNEQDVRGYSVERSNDNKTFREIGEVRYQRGTANTYSFSDASAITSDVVYYRIKQITTGNSINYSPVAIAKIRNGSGAIFTAGPNPLNGRRLNIRFQHASGSSLPVVIRMITPAGVTVWQQHHRPVQGLNTVMVDQPGGLSNGVYYIQYIDNKEIRNTSLIVQH